MKSSHFAGRKTRLHHEQLEGRRLLTTCSIQSVGPFFDYLYCEGTSGGDSITFEQAGDTLTVKDYGSVVATYSIANDFFGGLDFVVVSADGGDDLVDASGVTDPFINFVIQGGSGGDTLFGGAGDDTIVGGSGNDFMVGNGGIDSFPGLTAGDVAFQ